MGERAQFFTIVEIGVLHILNIDSEGDGTYVVLLTMLVWAMAQLSF
jgi:hypothetical protein